MSKQLRVLGFVFVLISIAVSALATEITVRKDGTGDFLSINDAFSAAGANDTITVGPGTYPEPFIEVVLPVTLRSELGPAATIVDGQGTNRIFRFQYGVGTVVEGFTFEGGRAVAIADVGGAIVIDGGADVVVRDCAFRYNTADAGGALYVTKAATNATVTGCSFTQNNAPTDGGAIRVAVGAVLNVDQCTFESNSAGTWGGAIHAGDGTTLNVSKSLFHDNTSDVGGGIYTYRAMGTIQTSTFWRNTSKGATSNGTLTMDGSSGSSISRNILSEDTAGLGLCFPQGESNHGCNLFWGNAKGSIAGGSLSSDELVSDPLFCSPVAGDFTISEGSLAAANNSACGLLIGAYEVGCGVVGVRESTWGRIKSMYAPADKHK